MKDAILCIDIGTSSLKAAYMEDSPKSLAFARYTFKDTTKQKAALEWMTGVKACLEELRMKQPEVGIEAICISGNGPTIVSEDGTTLLWSRPVPSTVTDKDSLFLNRIDGFRKTYPLEWHESTSVFSGPEYLIYSLTGAKVTILPEERYEKIYWTDAQLKAEGFSADEAAKLPVFVKPGALAGKVNKQAAELTGLTEGTLVFCGAPDFIVALIGTDTLDNGLMCDRAGSSEGINLCTSEPIYAPNIRTLPSIIPGMWNASVLIPDTGSRFAVFKDKVEKEIGQKITHKNLVALLVDWDKEGTEKIISEELKNEGLTVVHDVTHQLWAAVNILKQASQKAKIPLPRSMTITGGQALNEKWTQVKCDTLCIPISVTECVDAELVGDNVLARIALGYYDSIEEAAFALVKKAKTYMPTVPADHD